MATKTIPSVEAIGSSATEPRTPTKDQTPENAQEVLYSVSKDGVLNHKHPVEILTDKGWFTLVAQLTVRLLEERYLLLQRRGEWRISRPPRMAHEILWMFGHDSSEFLDEKKVRILQEAPLEILMRARTRERDAWEMLTQLTQEDKLGLREIPHRALLLTDPDSERTLSSFFGPPRRQSYSPRPSLSENPRDRRTESSPRTRKGESKMEGGVSPGAPHTTTTRKVVGEGPSDIEHAFVLLRKWAGKRGCENPDGSITASNASPASILRQSAFTGDAKQATQELINLGWITDLGYHVIKVAPETERTRPMGTSAPDATTPATHADETASRQPPHRPYPSAEQHVCDICGTSFESGKALGGHRHKGRCKRVHAAQPAPENTAPEPSEQKIELTNFIFQLAGPQWRVGGEWVPEIFLEELRDKLLIGNTVDEARSSIDDAEKTIQGLEEFLSAAKKAVEAFRKDLAWARENPDLFDRINRPRA